MTDYNCACGRTHTFWVSGSMAFEVYSVAIKCECGRTTGWDLAKEVAATDRDRRMSQRVSEAEAQQQLAPLFAKIVRAYIAYATMYRLANNKPDGFPPAHMFLTVEAAKFDRSAARYERYLAQHWPDV